MSFLRQIIFNSEVFFIFVNVFVLFHTIVRTNSRWIMVVNISFLFLAWVVLFDLSTFETGQGVAEIFVISVDFLMLLHVVVRTDGIMIIVIGVLSSTLGD